MRRARVLTATACAAAVLAAAVPAGANGQSEALRARAIEQIYELDRDQAMQTYRKAIAADPQDAAAYRGVATVLWLSVTFRRGSMTVDDYLGKVSRPGTQFEPPPPETVAGFREALDRATALARAQIRANPKDANAHYQLGTAVGLRASYIATIEGSALGAFRAAREAYDEHETVLELDPRRKDAGLIVGTYRYIVSALALPLRWMAYIVGFGGGRELGLRMIEGAAAYPGDNQADARTALILLYNREKRYDEALRELATMRERYPRNRLMWLETGATALRAGRAADADRFLTEGLTRFASDTRPRMFGEDALWRYKRGAARAALGRTADAEEDLKKALSFEGRRWVYGRARLEIGKLELKAGNPNAARVEFLAAIPLCESDNDGASADEARRLLR